jgi:hypothetical protein
LTPFKYILLIGKLVLIADNSGVELSVSLIIAILVSMGFSFSFLLTPEKLGTGSSSGSLLKK